MRSEPLTVRMAFQLVADEVQACARSGESPGDVASNLIPASRLDAAVERAAHELCTLPPEWLAAVVNGDTDRDYPSLIAAALLHAADA